MENQRIRGTIFCGGTAAYTTSNDLLKLLRDVLEIKPDIVISYAGVNDLSLHKDFKMYNRRYYESYTKVQLPKYFIFPNLIKYIVSINKTKNEKRIMPIELYGGVISELNDAEYMIRNWKIMNEICKLHEIKFYGVCQPCVGSTERTRNDENLISDKWKEDYLHNDELWCPCVVVTWFVNHFWIRFGVSSFCVHIVLNGTHEFYIERINCNYSVEFSTKDLQLFQLPYFHLIFLTKQP
jgi:hypothetical protein